MKAVMYFGNDFTTLAVLDENNQIKILKNSLNEETTPSSIAIDDEMVLIGSDALHNKNVITQLPYILQTSDTVEINNKKYSTINLITMYLSILIEDIENTNDIKIDSVNVNKNDEYDDFNNKLIQAIKALNINVDCITTNLEALSYLEQYESNKKYVLYYVSNEQEIISSFKVQKVNKNKQTAFGYFLQNETVRLIPVKYYSNEYYCDNLFNVLYETIINAIANQFKYDLEELYLNQDIYFYVLGNRLNLVSSIVYDEFIQLPRIIAEKIKIEKINNLACFDYMLDQILDESRYDLDEIENIIIFDRLNNTIDYNKNFNQKIKIHSNKNLVILGLIEQLKLQNITKERASL